MNTGEAEEKFIGFLTGQIRGLLMENSKGILRGYEGAGDDTFTISASIKLNGTREVIESDTTIGFTLEKVKANSQFTIDMNQLSMFSEETGEEMEFTEEMKADAGEAMADESRLQTA